MFFAVVYSAGVFGFPFSNVESVNFDSLRPGSFPPHWTIVSADPRAVPHWEVKTDRTAPSRPNVLAQDAPMRNRRDSSVALFDNGYCHDGELSVDMKIVSGKMEQTAGVIWRFQDGGNYYFALASADRDSVGIFKKENQRVSVLGNASVPHRIDDHEWNLLKVRFRGPHVTLFFGHRKLIETEDTALDKPGKSGVWTRADTVAYFDNFRIDKKN
jgi:hypothetical protein